MHKHEIKSISSVTASADPSVSNPQIDLSGVVLETRRLILRAFRQEDLADFNEYARVEGVGEMAGWNHHKSLEESAQILKMFLTNRCELAIEFKQTGKVIGAVGLHKSWTADDPELSHLKVKDVGYVLSKDYWGHGIMPEAVKAVIDFCFKHYCFDALTCGHFTYNKQSQRVIEKCGFTFVKDDVYYSKQLDNIFEHKSYILYK